MNFLHVLNTITFFYSEEHNERGSPLNDLPTSPPRKQWGYELYKPCYGPSSMTSDSVALEVISCDHQDICDTLTTRQQVNA